MNIISYYTMILALFSDFAKSKLLMQAKTVHQLHDKLNTTAGWRSPCPDAQIQVSQGLESTSGIPRYGVMIANLCSNCWVAEVHLHCGWFASANVVNPQMFKRMSYDDCLVNGGKPIPSGHVIQFHYSNTYSYPLSVASYVCSP
ncbi:UNVERIFIED_CONTAM: protein TAPETUM DETERMINANT 1 [Sesamum radiatum]|uniref:Protein TAPETUM DETERMINANT 1 n=1 Tax=Sesamum radiatum TaxID=300843 RepID=A0AAW2NTZ9_SESRA